MEDKQRNYLIVYQFNFKDFRNGWGNVPYSVAGNLTASTVREIEKDIIANDDRLEGVIIVNIIPLADEEETQNGR